jgi:asparagine synthetase B (glutamine-hydrolysing)
MDVNIATALWFAASSASDECRILLTGLGADELMGGYGRHRKAWERGGCKQLRQELDLDMGRLWDRNLGRDDTDSYAATSATPEPHANITCFLSASG